MDKITEWMRDTLIRDEYYRQNPTPPILNAIGLGIVAAVVVAFVIFGVQVSRDGAVQEKEAKAQEAFDNWISAVNKSGIGAGRMAAQSDGMSGKTYGREENLPGLAAYKKARYFPKKASTEDRLASAQESFQEGFKQGYLSEMTFSSDFESRSVTEESPRAYYNAGYEVGRTRAETDANAGSDGPNGTRDEQVIEQFKAHRSAYARLPGYPTSTNSSEPLSQCQEKYESGFNDGFREVCNEKRLKL